MRNVQKFIDDLAGDLLPVRPFLPGRVALAIWAFGWIAATALTLLTGSFRPGVLEQLLESPQFAVESSVGLLAGALVTFAAMTLAVPGRHGSRWLWIAGLLMISWVGAYGIGLLIPALEPSMLGKRAACNLQVVAFAIPILLVGAWMLRRGYLLDGWPAGAALGVAAGAVPALLMQFACMYDPAHILIHHLGPVAITALLGAGLGYAVQPRRRRGGD